MGKCARSNTNPLLLTALVHSTDPGRCSIDRATAEREGTRGTERGLVPRVYFRMIADRLALLHTGPLWATGAVLAMPSRMRRVRRLAPAGIRPAGVGVPLL